MFFLLSLHRYFRLTIQVEFYNIPLITLTQ
jgi:hypothetical protein